MSEAVLKPINFAQEWVFQVIYSKELLGFTWGSAVHDHDLLVFGKLDSFGLWFNIWLPQSPSRGPAIYVFLV